jgi:hypothetical protein
MSAPYSRASAVSLAEATASQQSQVRGGASAPVSAENLQRLRVEFLDDWDSRWQRDPGRANGPYS